MTFKGAVHYSQWVKFIMITGLVTVAFLKTDFSAKGSFIVVPGLLLMNIVGKIRAKLIIENSKVTISQFENRHEFELSSIRRIEKIEYAGWKKLIYPVDGIHIFYNRIEDAIFYPKNVDVLEKVIREAALKQEVKQTVEV